MRLRRDQVARPATECIKGRLARKKSGKLFELRLDRRQLTAGDR